jgi:thymidylate kinase
VIIELFGPPGSGKTTFAHALTTRLRRRGIVADIVLSFRPAEQAPVLVPIVFKRQYLNAVAFRLSRPIVELLAIASHPFANYRDFRIAMDLVSLLCPANFFSSIREMQYLVRLSHSWYERSGFPGIALFDQGFVQAICSLALSYRADDASIANALDSAPKSDLLIRLDAPPRLLESRLKNRRRSQGTIERLFELDLNTSLSSVTMIDRLHNLLLKQRRSVLRASSINQRALDESLNVIEQAVIEKANIESKVVA